jgi:predicted nucleic acid-binding protein
VTYLLDTSAYVQSRYNRTAADLVGRLTAADELAVCSAVMLEILYGARNRKSWTMTRAALDALTRVELTSPYDVIATQERLVNRGQHRTSIIDVMVATTAAEHGLTVLHYDRDFEQLSEVTGAGQEWVVSPGDGHTR